MNKNNIWIFIIIILIIIGVYYIIYTPKKNNNIEHSNQISYEFTKEMATEVSYSETKFNPQEIDRSSNIVLALSKLNNKKINPNEVLSLNEVLGARSIENGYKEAPVIIDGELVPGIGGGVCQVATTLYSAVIKTNMTVTERKHHDFPPTYTEAGQDATIAGNTIDFKFKNTTNYPFFIVAGVIEDRACISLLSKKDDSNTTIKIESEMINIKNPEPNEIIKDSSIKVGESIISKSSKKGYEVAVYKNIYKDNKLIKRTLISKDTYKPIRGITKIGTDS